MNAKILGYKPVSFQANSGETIKGISLYLSFPDEQVIGEMAERYFLRNVSNLSKELKIGDKIDVTYDRKGKIESISKL